VRLTALYAGAFLTAGVLLVAAAYWLVSQSLRQPFEHRSDLGNHQSPGTVDAGASELAREAVDAYRANALNGLLTWSLIALLGTLVLAVVLGWMLAGRALRPLRQVTATANRVAHRSLHERIALSGPKDEIKELADTIDAMLERLDRSFDAQRRFVANASHELRTPLAVNRALLEVAISDPNVSDDMKQLAPTFLSTNERSERLIEGLLTLARSEHTITDRSTIDLAAVAAVAVEQQRSEAVERGIATATDLRPAPVEGNQVLVERLVGNLIQNAIRHGSSDAAMVVRTRREGPNSVLEVENSGVVLRPHEIDGMFEPFRRGNGRLSADGVGLGLSIVRSVAHAHQGSVSARPRGGGGMIVRVEFPTVTN
jgi:signal transduction histidine kinase